MDTAQKLSEKLRWTLLKNKWVLWLIGCTVLLIAAVLISAIVLLALRIDKDSHVTAKTKKAAHSIKIVLVQNTENKTDHIHSTEKGKQRSIVIYDDKHPTLSTYKAVYIEEAGDIGRITVQRHHSTTVIDVLEGVVVGQINETYIFLQRNGSQGAVVDMKKGRIIVLASAIHHGNGVFMAKEISKSPLKVANSSAFSNVILISLGGKNPLKLIRKGANGEEVVIQTNAETTIFERRGMGEVKLLLGKRSNLAAATANSPQQGNLWEEMLIRPHTLDVSAVNSRGSLDFQNRKAVYITSHLKGNISGSPFEHKFGRMSNENGTIEVDFAVDNCGKGHITNRYAGTESWWRPKPFSGGTKNADNRTLWFRDERYLSNSEGTLSIDLKKETVVLSNATEASDSVDGTRWRTWSTPSAHVEMKNVYKDPTAWDVRSEEGAFVVQEFQPFQLRSAANDSVNRIKDQIFAFGRMGQVFMWCNYFFNILKFYEDISVTLLYSNFKIEADVGSVFITNGSATITSLAATIFVTPYKI